MIQGSYEETEILLQHSEFVLASLEQAARQFRDDGDIMKQLNSPDGVKLRNYAASVVEAKQQGIQPPQLPSNLTQMREKIAMQMIMPIRTIDYTVYWCKLSAAQLKSITAASRDFDLRWNLPITLCACKLFSAFCRIVLYLHRITPATFLIHLFSSSTLVSTLPLQCRFDELLKFVSKSQEQPFVYIAEVLSFIKNKLSLMVVSLLPFFSTLFADWTIFDWSLLSIYERPPESTIGDSMPLNEYTLLANISLFQEVLLLFTLTFSTFMDENQQFAVLGTAVLSESNIFYLSRNYPVPVDELLKVAQKSNVIQTLEASLAKATERKTAESHLHRMKQLALLAGEVVNYAGLDMNGFMRYIHIIRAIAGFSYYEIDLFFRVKNKTMWTDEHVKTVSKLLSFAVKLSTIFIQEKTQIERFFLFNLATVDADHLSYLLNKFGKNLGTAGGDVVATGQLILESLEDLSLEKFDQGIRYDFYPLQLTHGRALHRHNIISQRLRASFLTPLCEHLMTISLHASAAQDAVRFFLDACHLHTLWRHARRFEEFINIPSAPIGECAEFFNLFQLFNYDSIVLTMHTSDSSAVAKICENKIRQLFSSKIFSMLSLLLNPKSRLVSFSMSGPIGQDIPSENLSLSLLDNGFCYKEAQDILSVAQANNLIEALPKSVTVLGKVIEISPYIIRRISNDVIKIVLFNIPSNVTSVSNTAQIVWTFFSQSRALNIDQFEDTDLIFRRALLECTLKNTFFNSPSFTEQAKALLGKAPVEPPGTQDQQRLIYKLKDSMMKFIHEKHEKYPYCQFTNGFANCNEQTVHHYRALFRTLGIHGGIYIDAALIRSITDDIYIILQSFEMAYSIINDRAAVLKQDMTASAAKALQRVAIAATLRKMVRRALKMVIEESVPGIIELINANAKDLPDTPECHLLIEIVANSDDMYFIKERFHSRGKKQDSDLEIFYSFVAILYTSFNFKDVTYNEDFDSLSNNYHILPVAFSVLRTLSPSVFSNAGYEMISQATKTFFTTISEIMDERKKKMKGAINDQSWNSFNIMIDKFMKFVPDLEYGLIKHAFQYSVLALSYPKVNS
jgi:hypothetical protein